MTRLPTHQLADATSELHEVVVVGSGIAGASLFYELTRRGVSALLLERGAGTAEQGATSTLPAALINPYRGRTARARQLDLDGARSFWRTTKRLRELGHEPGSRQCGLLRIASNHRQAAAWRKLQGDELEWLEPTEIPRPYHAPFGGLRVVTGGWVEPRRLLPALLAASLAAGGRVAFGSELRGRRSAAAGGQLLDVVQGGRSFTVRAREVALCLGAYDARTCRLPRLELASGLALTLSVESPERGRPPLPPLAGAIGVVPQGSEVHLTGAALRTTEPSPAELAEAAEKLQRAGSWFLPALGSARVVATWTGTRARRPSGTPVVRRLAPGVTLFGGLAGRGFLCGPHLAERLAERLIMKL